jgi:hypothetical protein
MSVRAWFALLLGALLIPPAAQTTPHSIARLDQATTVLVDAQRAESVLYDFRSLLVSTNYYGLSADTASAFEKIPLWSADRCGSSDCVQARAVILGRGVDAGAGTGAGADHTSVAGDRSDSEAMTAPDLVLMLLFAAALVAYQLGRKQRALQQSSLFVASL